MEVEPDYVPYIDAGIIKWLYSSIIILIMIISLICFPGPFLLLITMWSYLDIRAIRRGGICPIYSGPKFIV